MPAVFANKDSRGSVYESLYNEYTSLAKRLNDRLRWLSVGRLIFFCTFLFLVYKAFYAGEPVFIITGILSFGFFVFFLKRYDKLQQRALFFTALARINHEENHFLETNESPYPTGEEYADPHHPYSYDLDLFGKGGLFPYLNRASTQFGRQALARLLLDPEEETISRRQQAVAELKEMIEFRQQVQAYGMIQELKDEDLRKLNAWLDNPSLFRKKRSYYGLLIFPLTTLGILTLYIISERESLLNFFYLLLILNIGIAFSFAKKISGHLSVSNSVTKVLQQFSAQFRLIENQRFHSPLLQSIQQSLKAKKLPASKSIGRLASLFNYLETVINLVVSIILNGLFLFHVHVLYSLEKWKKLHGKDVRVWLELLGKMESLNSFANLYYNNPRFCIPVASNHEILNVTDLGHPLIKESKRVVNSISFGAHPFIILTGSNMSGKSTFLRTLGINLILARAGSAVCASSFEFFPYKVEVSMRVSDSLQDNESFFYAELKRLQHIIQQLEAGNKIFIILDEILRGTNSNDKHNGTVELIRKLLALNTCGIIATHDLTVSKLSEEFPALVANQCFESQILNDELLFDYRLRPGVCTTLSASFLMRKMGIIS
jgi:hypothetical protein